MASPYRISEEMLRGTSPDGMSRTSAPPGPNMYDSGPTAKVQLNNQDFNNQRLEAQNMQQNMVAGLPQAQADAIMGVRKNELIQDNAAYKAVQMREESKALMLDAMDAPHMKALGMMNPLETEIMRKDAAITKASIMGVNPDLVA